MFSNIFRTFCYKYHYKNLSFDFFKDARTCDLGTVSHHSCCFTFSVGTTKILAGAGIAGLGLLPGNQQLQQSGGTLTLRGGHTSIGAYLFGKKKK